jgi:hypothetical protein
MAQKKMTPEDKKTTRQLKLSSTTRIVKNKKSTSQTNTQPLPVTQLVCWAKSYFSGTQRQDAARRLGQVVGNHRLQRMIANKVGRQAFPQVQRHGEHDGLTNMERYRHTLQHAGTTQATWDANYVNNATFLGIAIARGVHQELVGRLSLAENYLRDQHPGMSDADIVEQIGLYSISGRRPPGNAVGGSTLSNHAYGLAIDVNYRGNPFIGRSARVDQILNRATELMLDQQFHIRQQQTGTPEEIRSRYEEASNALRDYFGLRDQEEALQAHLNTRGLPAEASDVQRWLQQINNDYTNRALLADFATQDPDNPRDPAAGFIDLTQELVEALVNQAGLFWGGQYRTSKDIMHFDWRNGTIRTNHRI